MQKLWNWLVTSSTDPQKLALTVKGILGVMGSVVLMLSPLTHIKVSSEQVNLTIDTAVQIVLMFCTIISSIVAILGFIRKIYLTFKPTE